jgi:hypothetical protein
MKMILGIAAMGLLFSIPAYGQGRGFGVGSSPSAALNFGGGSVGSGSVGGSARAQLPANFPTQFLTAAFSGEESFAPSSFLTFQQAVEEGKLESAPQKSVAQVAAENQAAAKAKSRVAFVQDARGNVVPVPRS